jgi:hypothetical protein
MMRVMMRVVTRGMMVRRVMMRHMMMRHMMMRRVMSMMRTMMGGRLPEG